jgi:hypothetical protein
VGRATTAAPAAAMNRVELQSITIHSEVKDAKRYDRLHTNSSSLVHPYVM